MIFISDPCPSLPGPQAVWDAHVSIVQDYVTNMISPQPSSSLAVANDSGGNEGKGIGEYNLCPTELAAYTGADQELPILLSVGGIIFDVTAGAKFYGPSGPYKVFAGCACTRALALGSLDASDRNDNLDGVSEKAVQGQVDFYTDKYKRVGKLKKDC